MGGALFSLLRLLVTNAFVIPTNTAIYIYSLAMIETSKKNNNNENKIKRKEEDKYNVKREYGNIYVLIMSYFYIGGNHKKAVQALNQKLMPILIQTWKILPVIQVIVFKTLPPMLWSPFFNLVGFLYGISVRVRLAKLQRKKQQQQQQKQN